MNTASKKIKYLAILIVLITVALPLVLLMGKYDKMMLIAIPMGIGISYALFMSVNKQNTLSRIFQLSWIPLGVAALASVVIAREGAICLIIIGLFLLIPYFAGIIIGYMIQHNMWMKNTMLLLVMGAMLGSATIIPAYNESRVVQDEIIIAQSAARVWKQLTAPVYFGSSKEFYFANGVSYPISMQLQNIGGKQYLNCHYNNGDALAPVISFKDQQHFAFQFNDSLVTMKERNFYRHSQTMHITNHFEVDYGKFEVIPLDSNHCRLVASTSFRHKFEPEFYTNLWVSYFVHGVHRHVLHSIAAQNTLATTKFQLN